jgi:hypothetical protein
MLKVSASYLFDSHAEDPALEENICFAQDPTLPSSWSSAL